MFCVFRVIIFWRVIIGSEFSDVVMFWCVVLVFSSFCVGYVFFIRIRNGYSSFFWVIMFNCIWVFSRSVIGCGCD